MKHVGEGKLNPEQRFVGGGKQGPKLFRPKLNPPENGEHALPSGGGHPKPPMPGGGGHGGKRPLGVPNPPKLPPGVVTGGHEGGGNGTQGPVGL